MIAIVGLPDTEVKESKDRVRAALQNARFEFPARRITVNLAPADLPKESGRFDLPIALGILAASGQIPADTLDDYEFAGELSLSGELRPIRGALAMTYAMHKAGDSTGKRCARLHTAARECGGSLLGVRCRGSSRRFLASGMRALRRK
jgi:magnesium chelatase family protein